MGENILEVKHMTVTLYENGEEYKVVNRISFTVGKGEIVGIVGESGCGKSMTALALQDLLKNHIKVTEGSMMFDGRDLRKVTPAERRQINGKDMTMIFQEPMTSLNPLHRIGRQVGEVLQLHGSYSHAEIEKRTLEALSMAGLPDPAKTMRMYPHELSGGMRQRVMIAMGIIASPKLLIADEPTTAPAADQSADRHGCPPDLPRSGSHQQNLQPRPGDVCRQDRGAGAHGGHPAQPYPSLYQGTHCFYPDPPDEGGAARQHPGPRPSGHGGKTALSLRVALRQGGQALLYRISGPEDHFRRAYSLVPHRQDEQKAG